MLLDHLSTEDRELATMQADPADVVADLADEDAEPVTDEDEGDAQ